MRRTILGLVLFGFVLAIVPGLLVTAQRRERTKIELPIQSRDKLHQLAKKSGGHFVLRYRPNRSTVYPNLDELAKRSDIIVVGRTLGHRTSLRADGNFVTQDFLVKVQETIKGDLPPGKSITVSLPGGSYMFPDKTYIVVTPMGQQPATDKETYVFFLKAQEKGSVFKGHVLASESQGMFALAKGKVEPSDLTADHPLVRKYRQMAVPDFLRQLHQAVPRSERKEPGTGK